MLLNIQLPKEGKKQHLIHAVKLSMLLRQLNTKYIQLGDTQISIDYTNEDDFTISYEQSRPTKYKANSFVCIRYLFKNGSFYHSDLRNKHRVIYTGYEYV